MESTQQPFNIRFWTIALTSQVAVISMSNYLVQLPLELFGYTTTWATFSFPLVYLIADLTVRLQSDNLARWVALMAVLPSLCISYVLGMVFKQGEFQNWDKLLTFDSFVARITLASLFAYLVGQLMDIGVFKRLMRKGAWWIAPSGSSCVGNFVDTFAFFSLAFYLSAETLYAESWVEMASVDFVAKMAFSLVVFLPIYRVLVNALSRRMAGSNTQRLEQTE